MSKDFELSKTFSGRAQNAPKPQRLKTAVNLLPLLGLLGLALVGLLAIAGYLTNMVIVDWNGVWAPFARAIDRVMWIADRAMQMMP